jgi:hypothetical protein
MPQYRARAEFEIATGRPDAPHSPETAETRIVIIFLVTDEHCYTLEDVAADATETRIQIASYSQLFGSTHLPRATYVFTDLDRLPTWQVRKAATVYRGLRDQGVKVLNDPALVPSRFGLLRRLALAGFNQFNAYRVEEGAVPARWPVFLRAEGAHDAPLSDLLHNWDEARHAVDAALDSGVPLPSLIFIEFAAEPAAPGLYRKLGIYKVGAHTFADTCVHDVQWVVKYGQTGIATPELYADELRIARDNPFCPAIEPAFQLTGIEFGRADFGLVGGRVQLYEINTNPTIRRPTEHPSADRVESMRVVQRNLFAALRAIDTPDQ